MFSTASISEYLEGLSFPATKEEIVSYAEERNAPPELLDALSAMADTSDGFYFSMASIWDSVGVIA